MAGRKPILIDRQQVETLLAIQCSTEEVCAVVGCSIPTLRKWVVENTEFDTWVAFKDACMGIGKAKLRQAMWNKALKQDHAEMQKFLAKNELGMTDKVEQDMAGTLNVTVAPNVAANVK